VWPLPLLIIGVIGSMYAGIATPTEAAAVGVVLSLVIALARRQLTYANLRESLNESIVSSAAIFFIALGAIMMTRLMALSGLPVELAGAMREWAVNPLLLVLATSVLYLVMGCFIDPIGMVLLSLPVLIPMFKEFDLDLVWFGILVVKFVEIGLISPPLGLNVFAVRTLTPDVSLGVVYKGAAWFLFCEIGVVALLIIFPGLTSMFAK
jgi:tripartite ATP-independent transporter DctM subunit